MTLKSRWIFGAALALVLTGAIAAGTTIYAQGGPGFQGPRRGFHGMAVMRELAIGRLDLTDAQRQQVRTIVQGQRDAFTQINDRRRTAQRALNDAIAAPVFDEAAIRAKAADLAAVEADAAVLRGRVRSEVWAILTPEQQQKATELRAKIQQRFEERRQRRQQFRQQQQQQQAPRPPAER